MRIETREVVIVGGGPAGAVAGMLLARAGHDVLLLERQALPRRKACGDCISAGSTRLFERLGLLPAILELQCARLRGWRIVAPDGSSFTATFDEIAAGNPQCGYALAVSRERLDAVLLDAAGASGVEIRPRTRVTHVTFDNGPLLRLHGSNAAVRARLVIGADGLRSVVARSLGAVRRRPRVRKLSLSTHAPAPRPTAGLGEMHLAPGACIGIAPVDAAGATYNVTLVVKSEDADVRSRRGSVDGHVAGRERAARLDGFVNEWRERFSRLRDAAPIRPLPGEEWMASGPFDVPVQRVAHDGIVLVGDAAGYFDPFTGQGIHQAVAGAELLAHAASGALRRPGPLHRERLAEWERAHASLALGMHRVQRLIDEVLARPALANAAIRALARSDAMRNALLGVTSDLRSPASLLHPHLAASTLHSLLRAS